MTTIHWRVTMETARQYEDIAARLSWISPVDDADEYATLKDDLQRLPDFPTVDDPENTLIVPVVDGQKRMYHFLS